MAPTISTFSTFDFVTIDQILRPSSESEAPIVRILEMDCFGGMSDREIALMEHISTMKAKQDREFARTWLSKTLAARTAAMPHKTGKESIN